ncbi:hypothetical protein O9X98_04600 [Agrobacterium salinitolerans]|nr:hypothetical protein [Agrobacterium salinitolerans]
MDPATTYQRMLIDSDLMVYSFELRSPSFSASQATDLVGWLASEFTLARCSWFASAIAFVRGREHYVAFTHGDGRIAHAAAAVAPQFDPANLKGEACDILGRRPLGVMLSELKHLNRSVIVEIGLPVLSSDFDDGELDALVALAAELPWCSRLVGKSPKEPDGARLWEIAVKLGMPTS